MTHHHHHPAAKRPTSRPPVEGAGRRSRTGGAPRLFADLALAAMLPLLTACAGPKVTALDVEIARHQAEAQRACYAAQALPPYEDARDAALIVMARALAPDPCKQANVYDSRARIAEAQNQAAAQAVGGVMQGAAVVAGIVAGADVLKAAVRGAGGNIVGDSNITTKAEGSATATGPDQHRHTTTTTHMTP